MAQATLKLAVPVLPYPTSGDPCSRQLRALNVGLIGGVAVGGLFAVVVAVLVTVAIIRGALWIKKRQELIIHFNPKKVFLTQSILNLRASYAIYPHMLFITPTVQTNPLYNICTHLIYMHDCLMGSLWGGKACKIARLMSVLPSLLPPLGVCSLCYV